MKKFALIFLLCPLFASAQEILPRFVNDTLYTSSGYKIYKGHVLQLATGTAEDGKKFQFIKLDNGGIHLPSGTYKNTSITVKKLHDYKITGLGNRYIGIKGTLTYKDGSKTGIGIDINFDRAINNYDGLPGEIIVPEEFRNKKPTGVTSEIERLFTLYKEGALTREEYEALKKKVIEKN